MKIFLTTLLFSSLITPIAPLATEMIKENQNYYATLSENLTKGNENSFIGDGIIKQIPDTIPGSTFDEINGVYIDSTNDTMTKRKMEFEDRTINFPYCQKDREYKRDISDYTKNFETNLEKEDFLKSNKYVTFDVQVANNTWNSTNKWTNKDAKKSTFKRSTIKFILTGEYQKIKVVDFTDSHHHNKERTYLAISENWKDNVLDLQINAFCWVTWDGKKHAEHAAFIQWKLANWTFSSGKYLPSFEEEKGKFKFKSKGDGEYHLPINDVFLAANKIYSKGNNIVSKPLVLITTFTTRIVTREGTLHDLELFYALPWSGLVNDLAKAMIGKGSGDGTSWTFDITPYSVGLTYLNSANGHNESIDRAVDPKSLMTLRQYQASWKGIWMLTYSTYKVV